ncbi:MAG: histidinol-phosphatase [SAR324 cluster bacterium]|nr:histidinol-phosphatase [SAR324 cluster bacterium]
MRISFHGGHSGDYCDHAGGKLEDVVRRAIATGFTHYGLSEHMPRVRDEDLYPEEIQRSRNPEQLRRMFAFYIQEARQLQYKYKNQIHLLVGMETELLEQNDFSPIDRICKTYTPDYLVGSVHHINRIPFDYNPAEFKKLESMLGGTEAVFCAYYDAQFQLMQHLQPHVVGHFDLIRLYRPDFVLSPTVWEKIERNLSFGISYDALFEINARAFKKHSNHPYPHPEILNLLLTLGGKVTLGDDSHHPDDVGLHFDRLFQFLQEQKISSLYVLEKDQQGRLNQKSVRISPF